MSEKKALTLENSIKDQNIEALYSDIAFLKTEIEDNKLQAKKEHDEMAEKFRIIQFKASEDLEKSDRVKTDLDLKELKILKLQQYIDSIEFDKTYYTETLPDQIKDL